MANLTLFGVISAFILMGLFRRINVYEAFIEGGKEGFNVAIRIIPYLVAVLVAIGVFRASGTLDEDRCNHEPCAFRSSQPRLSSR